MILTGKLPRRRFLELAGSTIALPALVRTSRAQAYPTRPVTLIVPFGAGGSNDVTSRILAKTTEKYLGQPIGCTEWM
jgi:tripartite-type tricarboxylate transporter receptor subunit TctC